MKAKLFRSGVDRGEPFEIGAEATIGRGKKNSIRLEPNAVSKHHARIYFDPESARYYLEDLDSLNGTKLDGVAVRRTEQLDRLHVIEFGGDGLDFVFQVLDLTPDAAPAEADAGPEAEPVAEAATSGTAVDREMPELPESLADDSDDAEETIPAEGTATDREMPEVPQTLLDQTEGEETRAVPPGDDSEPAATDETGPAADVPAGDEAHFFLQWHEPGDAEPIPLSPGNRVVGRARAADISVEDPSVSRRHAMLSVGPSSVRVRDLGSRNKTFVDGEPVDDEVEVKPGSVVRFGALDATLVAGEAQG